MSKDRDLCKMATVHATRKCMPMRHRPKNEAWCSCQKITMTPTSPRPYSHGSQNNAYRNVGKGKGSVRVRVRGSVRVRFS